jgi:hypothetical protein
MHDIFKSALFDQFLLENDQKQPNVHITHWSKNVGYDTV